MEVLTYESDQAEFFKRIDSIMPEKQFKRHDAVSCVAVVSGLSEETIRQWIDKRELILMRASLSSQTKNGCLIDRGYRHYAIWKSAWQSGCEGIFGKNVKDRAIRQMPNIVMPGASQPDPSRYKQSKLQIAEARHIQISL